MSDNKPLPPAVSPIKDTVKDGILTGREIAQQLRDEEQMGSMRTPTERVHGVLEALGLREQAETYAAQFKLYVESGNTEALEKLNRDAASVIQTRLEVAISSTSKPNYRQLIEQDRKNIETDSSITDNERVLRKADLDSADAFARASKVTFPKGVKIEPNEVLGIMGHFLPPGFSVRMPKLDSTPSTSDKGRV